MIRSTARFSRTVRHCRCLSSSSPTQPPDSYQLTQHLFPGALLHRRGILPYGSREYLLVQPTLQVDKLDESQVVFESADEPLRILGLLHANKNIMFGARSKHKDFTVQETCSMLVTHAILDCGEPGHQPQAIAALHGLCDFVQDCLSGNEESSVLEQYRRDSDVLECVTAIATNTPRTGHTVVGQGTHAMAADAWEGLAKEFIQQKRSPECELYAAHNGILIHIELLADTQPDYLVSAGGAMARYYFL